MRRQLEKTGTKIPANHVVAPFKKFNHMVALHALAPKLTRGKELQLCIFFWGIRIQPFVVSTCAVSVPRDFTIDAKKVLTFHASPKS